LIDKAGSCEYVEETLSCDAINSSLSADKNDSVTGKCPSGWQTTQLFFNLGPE